MEYPSDIQLSDEALMCAVAEGDERAFERLYERYHHKMLRFFFRMLGHDEEKAQDFLQDLFMKLIEKAHLYHADKRFSTWVYAIATNMCKNEYRSMSVRKIMRPWEETLSHDIAEEANVEAALHVAHFEDCLKEEIESLSEKHKEVFLLRYQEELSLKEISEILACSEGTVKSRIFYAIRRLSKALQAFGA